MYVRHVECDEGLVSRGYLDREIDKILGGNFLRLLKEVGM